MPNHKIKDVEKHEAMIEKTLERIEALREGARLLGHDMIDIEKAWRTLRDVRDNTRDQIIWMKNNKPRPEPKVPRKEKS